MTFGIFLILFVSLLAWTTVKTFSVLRKKPRADVLFLVLFCLFLCLPVLRINPAFVSEFENKALSKYMPLFRKGRINVNYGKSFEKWFNDRFFLREPVILFYNTVFSRLKTKQTPKVLFGKKGWQYYNDKESITHYQNTSDIDSEQLKKIARFFNGFNYWCTRRNKKFYVFIAPDKESIYPEYYPSFIKKLRPDSENAVIKIVNYLREKTDVNVFFPLDLLKSKKGEGLLFWKTDMHWNELGAYHAYRGFIELMQKDFPKLQPLDLTFNEKYIEVDGDLQRMTALPKTIQTDEYYKKSDYSYKAECSQMDFSGPLSAKHYLCRNHALRKNGLKVLVLRDSFFNALEPYFSETFYETEMHWQNHLTTPIFRQMKKADVVIFEFRAGTFSLLKNKKFFQKKPGQNKNRMKTKPFHDIKIKTTP